MVLDALLSGKDKYFINRQYFHGEMAEWLKAAVLKTAELLVGSVGSNPTLSAICFHRENP